MSTTISIVTVCLNARDDVQVTMDSVLQQKHSEKEYIVVDGGSIDGTQDIIAGCPAVTRWISEHDEGISDAFNKGLELCRGDVIAFLNAGDWYSSEAVSVVAKIFDQEDADVVHGKLAFWKEGQIANVMKGAAEKLELEMSVNHPAVFIRKQAYEEVGGYSKDLVYAMDYDLLLRLKLAGKKFVYADIVLTNMQGGGVSDVKWWKAYNEVRKIKTKHLGRSAQNWLYLLYQIARTGTRRLLERLGAQGVITTWRKFTM